MDRIRVIRPLAGPALRAIVAAAVGLVAALVYTGTPPFDGLPPIGGSGSGSDASAEATAVRLLYWLVAGGIAGLVGEGMAGLLALWAGVLVGHGFGLAVAGADQNTVLLYLLITFLGVAIFVTPGYGVGRLIAGRSRPPPEPDGGGTRPAPAPLWGDAAPDEAGPRTHPPRPAARGGAAIPLTRVRPGKTGSDPPGS